MKRTLKIFGAFALALGLLVPLNSFAANHDNIIPDKEIILYQEDENCPDYEIKTPTLDRIAEYISTIKDPIKKDLVEKYFYLPDSVTIGEKPQFVKEQKIDIEEQIKVVENLPIDELKKIVHEKEEKFTSGNLEVINYDNENTSLENKISESIKSVASSSYSHTLYGALTNNRTGSDVAYVKCRVEWGTNNNSLTWMVPRTETYKISYYNWYDSLKSNDYTSGGKGYVNKARTVMIGHHDQPLWEIYAEGGFDGRSTPFKSNGGYREF